MLQSVVICTACGRGHSEPDPFFYEWRGRQFEIFRCARCTHQFVHPRISPDEQAVVYDDHYFSRDGDWACGLFEASYAEAEQQLRQEAEEVLGFVPAKSGRLLDIGCAGGVFLDEARRRGFDVRGIELNPTQAKSARDRFGLEVAVGRIEDIPVDRWCETFDAVTILDCLEHIPEPLEALRKVARWTRPGGHLLVRGPLANSRIGRVKEEIRRALRIRKRLPGYPLDANMFNRRSMTAMLETAGFGVMGWFNATPNFANVLAVRAPAPGPAVRTSR